MRAKCFTNSFTLGWIVPEAVLKGLVRSPFFGVVELSFITITAPHIFDFTAEISHFANFNYLPPHYEVANNDEHEDSPIRNMVVVMELSVECKCMLVLIEYVFHIIK